MKKACGDPGHGGYDPGAVGPKGTHEADINLIVTMKAGKILQANGIGMAYTRDSNNVPWPSNLNADLAKRCQIANDTGADIFFSIHCNSGSATAKGTEIYTTPGDTKADLLATAINKRMKEAFPDVVFREDWSDGDPDKEAGFYVIRNTKMPAVLIELLFISNPAEEARLNSEDYQNKAALAIAKGIGDYFGINIVDPAAQQPAMPTQPADPQRPKIHVCGTTLEGIIIDGRTYAPVRAFGEALGKQVVWDPKNGVTVGGIKIDVLIIKDTSYAPVRYLAEALGRKVTWDQATQTVVIK